MQSRMPRRASRLQTSARLHSAPPLAAALQRLLAGSASIPSPHACALRFVVGATPRFKLEVQHLNGRPYFLGGRFITQAPAWPII